MYIIRMIYFLDVCILYYSHGHVISYLHNKHSLRHAPSKSLRIEMNYERHFRDISKIYADARLGIL